MITDILTDTGADVLKMLPFLFVAFLIIEALEHYSTEFTGKVLARVGKAGPFLGAAAGCVPQCGFSVMAANLYAGGILSPGTLVAVFTATSDEAFIILLGNPGYGRQVVILLGVKVIVAVLAGYMVDLSVGRYIAVPKEKGNLCAHCGCQEQHAGIVRPALRHTLRIFLYLLVFTLILNLCTELIGVDRLSAYLLGNTAFQPAVAALVGLLPSCAASVILTQLYLQGSLSFASVVAGLCAGAGVGLAVLFRVNRDRKENLKILAVLYVVAVAAGMLLEAAGM